MINAIVMDHLEIIIIIMYQLHDVIKFNKTTWRNDFAFAYVNNNKNVNIIPKLCVDMFHILSLKVWLRPLQLDS